MVALLFAASPLVDAAFIPLGIMRYSAWKSFLSLYTGKFIWILSMLYVARTSHQILIDTVGADLYTAIFSIGLGLSLAYLMTRINWEKRLSENQRSILGRLARRMKDLFLRRQQRNSATEEQVSTV